MKAVSLAQTYYRLWMWGKLQNEFMHELTDKPKAGLQYVNGYVLQNLYKKYCKVNSIESQEPWPSSRLEKWTAWIWTHRNKNWFQASIEGDSGQLHCQLLRYFWKLMNISGNQLQKLNFRQWYLGQLSTNSIRSRLWVR